VTALGLMSGTSMDGVDVAMLVTDGEGHVEQGSSSFRPYLAEERDVLRAALADAVPLTDRTARPGRLAEAEAIVTRAHAEAVEAFRAGQGAGLDIDLVGFHGQTVLHRPASRLTIQIGDGPELARRLGLPVVHDLRAADVALGGQGAPLVPVYHRALVLDARRRGYGMPETVAVLNLGGVGNVTVLSGEAEPLACDTGPANALVDDLMLQRTGRPYDDGGATAARGRVDEEALAHLMDDPYFDLPAPKSLDRNHFSAQPVASLSLEDAAATLTAFTAASVARIREHLPRSPGLWIVCGGGARNPTLMAMISERCGAAVRPAELFGWSADAMEAQAFAYLAVRSSRGLPLTFPGTTGVPAPVTGGVLAAP
jgi:anhydro-N-acetylmuramic acid kinase